MAGPSLSAILNIQSRYGPFAQISRVLFFQSMTDPLYLGSLLDIIKHRSKKDCKNGVLDEFVIATVVKEVLKGE